MLIAHAVGLAQNQLTKFGLTSQGWKVHINSRLTRALGRCCYSRREIELNPEYVERNSESAVMDTILHEIAHALAPGAGHGAEWKKACIRIGAKPNRLADPSEKVLPGKWQLVVVWEDGTIERTPSFATRRRNLRGCQLRDKPATLNKLKWLPAER